MQETNIVQDVGRSLRQTEKDDQKVESPQHLQDPNNSIIRLDVEEAKIPKARHPHIARNHDPDGIVGLFGVIIVIQQEHELHDSLPFLRLMSIQHVVVFHNGGHHSDFALWWFLPSISLPGVDARKQQQRRQEEELVPVVRFGGMRKGRVVFAQVGVEQNGPKDGQVMQEGVDAGKVPKIQSPAARAGRSLKGSVVSCQVGSGGQSSGGHSDGPEEHGHRQRAGRSSASRRVGTKVTEKVDGVSQDVRHADIQRGCC